MLGRGAQSTKEVQDLSQPGGLGACNAAAPGLWSGAPAHSPGPVTGGTMLRPGGAGFGICGRACQGQRPSGLGLGRGCADVRPPGVVAALSEAPSPILIVAAAMAWPGPFPAPPPGPVHTPYLGPSTWLMPRRPPGVFSSWGARHRRWRSGEAAEVLAWPAGPSRAPRPGLAGPLGRARRGAPRWERIGCPEPPTGEAEAVPR